MEMKLIDVKKNRNFKILKVKIEDERLAETIKNLGIKPGNYIVLLGSNYRKKSYMISIEGTRYALDKSICENIFVNA